MHFVAARRAEERIARLGTETAPWREIAPAFAAPLRSAVGFDFFALCQHDPFSAMPTGGFADDHSVAARHPRFWEIEFQCPDVNKLLELATAATPVATLSEATGGSLVRSTRWAELFRPWGLGDELRAALVIDGHCWASLSLHRERRGPAFTDRDVATVARLARPLATASRSSWTIAAPTSSSVPATGTLLFSAGGRAVAATDAGSRLSQELDPVHGVGSPILSAMAARIAAPPLASGHAGSLRSIARGADGSWIQLDANRLDARVGEATSAMTLQPAVPAAVNELLTRAYALTSRERQVVKLVLAGASNAVIAAELFLSPHTVSDHLKSIFTKTGVHTRQELAVLLAGGAP